MNGILSNCTLGEADGYSSVPPGQAIRVWSGGEGITEMDRVFVRSASLDGEAVVHFCRALCTVSQEELNPAIVHPDGSSPRVFSLRKLVECAYYNLGRIRLIWGRLWSTISSHLVNASCHSDQTVAMYSVDSLRQLVGKLLSRDELVNFTTQSDTLRPFVIVLKQCANVVVRELAVQCIEQAMNAHSSRLGSGWVVILEFLSVASLDPAPSVTRQCIDTLQSVVNVHWRKWGRGRDALGDCVTVALRVARNPHNTDCSLRAIQLIHACAKELVAELQTSELTDGLRSASMEYSHEESEEKTMQRTMSVPSGPPQYPRKEAPAPTEPLLSSSALWTVIFEALVEVMTREERRRCADSAADILFKLPSSSDFSSTWNQQTWSVFQFAVRQIFDIKEDAYAVESGRDRILSYSASFFPGLFSVITSNYETVGKSLLAHLLEILMVWLTTENQAMALSGIYLLQEMVHFVANDLDEEGWSIVIGRLQCAWNLCATQGKDGVPFVSWVEDEPLSVDAMRIRCQVLIALQRVLHQMHATLADKIPKNLIPRLIEILMRTVQQTAEVNSRPDVLKRFHQTLVRSTPPSSPSPQMSVEKTAEAESPQEKASTDSPQLPAIETEVQEIEEEGERTASEGSEKEAELQEENNEAGPSELPVLKTEFSQGAPPSPQDPVQSEDLSANDSIPELCTELISNEQTIFCGLLRIHVEGGMLTIRALRRRCQQEVPSTAITFPLCLSE